MLRLAAGSFDRVLDLEPDHLSALRHAIDLAAARRDTAAVQRLAPRYFAIDSSGALPAYYRWRVAVALNDRAGLARARDRFDSLPRETLERIVNVSQLDGLDLTDAQRAAVTLWSMSATTGEARWAFTKQRELALNRGRPAEAAAILDRWRATSTPFRVRDALAEVVNALFWDADTVVPVAWVAEHESDPRPAPVHLDANQGDNAYLPWCAIGLWHSVRGSVSTARMTIPIVHQGSRYGGSPLNTSLCAAIIEARLAAREGSPNAPILLARLDSLAATAPAAITWMLAAANLSAAELWEAAGDIPRALTAVRRRVHMVDIEERRVMVALSTMHRLEGRLAALAGDTSGAILAYRRYLGLRTDAEPSLAEEVAEVRAALTRLEGR
jgi:hypothetical protein